MLCRPGHTSAPAGPTPPAGPCVWRLLKLRCAPATVRLCVTHIRTVAGLLPGAQLGIVTAAAPTTCQPSSTASTVAILAQGTKWADALPQAFFQTAAWRCRWRCVCLGRGLGVGDGVGIGIGVASASASASASVSATASALALALALRGEGWRGVAWRGGVAGQTDMGRYHT
jgi:hypothetical protein